MYATPNYPDKHPLIARLEEAATALRVAQKAVFGHVFAFHSTMSDNLPEKRAARLEDSAREDTRNHNKDRRWLKYQHFIQGENLISVARDRSYLLSLWEAYYEARAGVETALAHAAHFERIETVPAWQHEAMKLAIALAAEELRLPWYCPDPIFAKIPDWMTELPGLEQPAEEALVRALAALKDADFWDTLPSGGFEDVRKSLKQAYPTGPVSTPPEGSAGDSKGNHRRCQYVPVGHVHEFRIPKTGALVRLIDETIACVEETRKAINTWRSDEGSSLNEHQYRQRMALYAVEQSSVETMQSDIEDQRRRRLHYIAARTACRYAFMKAEAKRLEVVSALKEALVEASSFAQEYPGKDLRIPRHLAIINCLAADLFLRTTARDLSNWATNYDDDLTNGEADKEIASLTAAYVK